MKRRLETMVLRAYYTLVEQGKLSPGLAPYLIVKITDYSGVHYCVPCQGLASKNTVPLPKEKGGAAKTISELLRDTITVMFSDEPLKVWAEGGFLNCRFDGSVLGEWILDSIGNLDKVGVPTDIVPLKINVEYCSVNPTGPITLGSGRIATFGSVLANVLEFIGHTVQHEFYINDSVESKQLRSFTRSVREIVLGKVPSIGGYGGVQTSYIAEQIGELPDMSIDAYRRACVSFLLDWQSRDFELFRVKFNTWTSEQSLYDSGKVQNAVEYLKEVGATYSATGRLYLKCHESGDHDDRVLVDEHGRHTYIMGDIAYHWDKYTRAMDPADLLITVLGADHHGYIPRLQYGMAALKMKELTVQESLEWSKQHLHVCMVQLVSVMQNGAPVRVSKRSGYYDTLIDTVEAIGSTVYPEETREEKIRVGVGILKMAYLKKAHTTPYNVDIEDLKDPTSSLFFSVNYAFSRLTSVLKKASSVVPVGYSGNPKLIAHDSISQQLILQLAEFETVLKRIGTDYSVHTLVSYLSTLTTLTHRYYEVNRILVDDLDTVWARACLLEVVKSVILKIAGLIGVELKEEMR